MHPTERFRHDLADALPLWLSEELVGPEQANALRAYYRLDALAAGARSGFVSLVLLAGAVLIGLGVISLVAANWAAIPPAARALCGLALMAGLDWWGVVWSSTPGRERRGAALLLLGTFLLGGNIALMAQWFQVGGDGWGLFVAWSAGAAAMAFALRDGRVAAMAAAILLFAMLSLPRELSWALPWVYLGLFVPLAYACRSRLTLYVSLGGTLATCSGLIEHPDAGSVSATLLVGALGLWSWARWHDQFAPLRALAARLGGTGGDPDRDPLADVAHLPYAALFLVLLILQIWGFHHVWRADRALMTWPPDGGPAQLTLGVLALAVGALWCLTLRVRHDRALHVALALAVGVTAAATVGAGNDLAGWWSVPINGLLLLLELMLAWRGLTDAARGAFWLGLTSLGLQMMARFLEYDTGLMVRAAVFIAWGALMIGIGLWFEQRLAALKHTEVLPC